MLSCFVLNRYFSTRYFLSRCSRPLRCTCGQRAELAGQLKDGHHQCGIDARPHWLNSLRLPIWYRHRDERRRFVASRPQSRRDVFEPGSARPQCQRHHQYNAHGEQANQQGSPLVAGLGRDRPDLAGILRVWRWLGTALVQILQDPVDQTHAT